VPVKLKEQSGPVIYKYVLSRKPGLQKVKMPAELGPFQLEILSFGVAPGRELAIWAVVQPSSAEQDRGIFLAMTGEAPPAGEARFIGAVNDSGYMIHCWDLGWK